MSDDLKLELLKLEYEKAADRYQEIYRSMWTIFSYLSAVSAGVLAYGLDKIETSALFAITPIPLFFWFTTTYLPLDRYGNKVLERLASMENLAGTLFQFPMCHFREVSDSKTTLRISGAFRDAWKNSASSESRSSCLWKEFQRQRRRARFVIWIWFWIVIAAWGYYGFQFWNSGKPVLLPKERVERPLDIELIQRAPLVEITR